MHGINGQPFIPRPPRRPRSRLVCALAALIAAATIGVLLTADRARAVDGLPPTIGLVVTGVTDTTIGLRWSPAGDAAAHPVEIGWQDEDTPKGSRTWHGTYPAGTDHITLTNLLPGHRHWIYVSVENPAGGMSFAGQSLTVTTDPPPAPAKPAPAVTVTPPAVTVTADVTPPSRVSHAVTPRPTATCQPRSLATRTSGTLTRRDTRRLTIKGTIVYWTPAGWQGVPSSDPVLTVQRLEHGHWRNIRTLTTGRAWTITAPKATYRLAFVGTCDQPAAPSASRPVTR